MAHRREMQTIVALATAPGRGGIAVVRVSGPLSRHIARQLMGAVPSARTAEYRYFRDARGEPLDCGIALFFPAPASLTGEDVLELQGHGSPVVMDLLIGHIVALGARLARPGEFTERAFLNDKIDLAQAEAVADLVDSTTSQAARCAQRSLAGVFSRRIEALARGMIEVRSHVEAAIDFPEEEIDFLSDPQLRARLDELLGELDGIFAAARQGCVLREGLDIVIAGRPNVGKSSLLNCLAGRDAAIVTDVPGTTRDLLREVIQIDGMPLHVSDTAGLRASTDPVEREGVQRAWKAIEKADAILLIMDDREGFGPGEQAIVADLPRQIPRIEVRNKIDLSGAPPGLEDGGVRLSAKTGAGVDTLRAALKERAGYAPQETGALMARRRHLDALGRATELLRHAHGQLDAGDGELLAEDLRLAHRALGEITGQFTTEELLERIFSSFCIGK